MKKLTFNLLLVFYSGTLRTDDTIVLSSFVPTDKEVVVEKQLKFTTYYTPRVKASVIQTDSFPREFVITNKGKDTTVFISNKNTGLHMEGFCILDFGDDELIIDHKHNVQPFVKNAMNTELEVGQGASNDYPLGTVLEYEENGKVKKIQITDRGSKVEGVDVFVERYTQKTFFTKVKVVK